MGKTERENYNVPVCYLFLIVSGTSNKGIKDFVLGTLLCLIFLYFFFFFGLDGPGPRLPHGGTNLLAVELAVAPHSGHWAKAEGVESSARAEGSPLSPSCVSLAAFQLAEM